VKAAPAGPRFCTADQRLSSGTAWPTFRRRRFDCSCVSVLKGGLTAANQISVAPAAPSRGIHHDAARPWQCARHTPLRPSGCSRSNCTDLQSRPDTTGSTLFNHHEQVSHHVGPRGPACFYGLLTTGHKGFSDRGKFTSHTSGGRVEQQLTSCRWMPSTHGGKVSVSPSQPSA
jgi:hypothetical protein